MGYDERGSAVSSPLALLSLAAVVLAGVVFVVTAGDGDDAEPATAQPVTASPFAPSPSRAPEQVVAKKRKQKKPEPVLSRGQVYVEVYNNSGISGLAGSTAGRIGGAGWQVVGSDNWYGTIPASTVYYPERLRDAAKLLAADLGIRRLRPAISPMRFDRLTVILTSDYA